MTADWEALRETLRTLQNRKDGSLRAYPDPRIDNQVAPFRITLATSALSAATDLHDRFGSAVDLTVGWLPYPPRQIDAFHFEDLPELPLSVAIFATRDPLVVPSGGRLETMLQVTNPRSIDLHVTGSPTLPTRVVDPRSGQFVGGDNSFVRAMGAGWAVPPGATVEIPMRLGTDSCVMDLGYILPAGRWAAHVQFGVPDGHAMRNVCTPALPLTIT